MPRPKRKPTPQKRATARKPTRQRHGPKKVTVRVKVEGVKAPTPTGPNRILIGGEPAFQCRVCRVYTLDSDHCHHCGRKR